MANNNYKKMNSNKFSTSLTSAITNKWRLLLVVLIISVAASSFTYFIIKDTLETTSEHQALIISEIVARHAAAGRTVYGKYVAKKLTEDGFGANIHSQDHPGYVPLPAQFLKLMAQESAKTSSEFYRYKPISKWHLEPTQGLNDNFENWAWQQLEAQDQSNPTGPIAWEPVWWTEEWQGEKYFRYLRADPASSKSCVDCHNAYLHDAKIKSQLKSEGITDEKQWKQHQLMGAISVTIPMEKIERMATTEFRQTIVWTSTILITALIIIGGIIIANTSPSNTGPKLSWDETHDKETGLLTLNGMEQMLASAIETAKLDNIQHGFICLKLQDTNSIQENHGAHIYNKFRKKLAENITTSLRHNDALGWLSNEKLGVLISDCENTQAKRIVEQLRQAAANTRTKLEDVESHMSVIITLTMITSDTLSVSSIIKTTDRIDHEAVSTAI